MKPIQQKMRSLRHHMKIGESGGIGTLGCYAWDEGIWRLNGIPHVVRFRSAEPMKRVSKHGWPKGWRLNDGFVDESQIIRSPKLERMPVACL